MNENELSKIVYECGLKIHQTIGPGLLESAYEECLFYELLRSGLYVERQKPMSLIYENIELNVGYRIDILVENKLVIEVKACEELANIHFAQTLTYLKLSGCKLGMLINFNTYLFKDGVKRIINGKL